MSLVATHEQAAWMSIHGTSRDDVWAVGADDGSGPIVLHYDGNGWERRDTGLVGDLWWVQALNRNTAFFAGAEGHIVRYHDGEFRRLASPGSGRHIVFGIWVAGPDDVYAVGARSGRDGFIWHFDGSDFRQLQIPTELLADSGDAPPLFKVTGRVDNEDADVWIVGRGGAVLRGNWKKGFEIVPTSTREPLFTVSLSAERVLIVGGSAKGVLLEGERSSGEVVLVEKAPVDAPLLQGAFLGEEEKGWAVGQGGVMLRREGTLYHRLGRNLDLAGGSLHAVWVDPEGGVWAVGGNVLGAGLDRGVVYGPSGVPTWQAPEREEQMPRCPEDEIDPHANKSIARRWNEQLLNAIRRDLPRPTVHARNLYHLSLAMWDAWAAYDAEARGLIFDELEVADDREQARREAISYASYRLLSHRYRSAVGGTVSLSCFDAFMDVLGLDPDQVGSSGGTPRALGNHIASMIIEEFAEDGSNEQNDYADPTRYVPENPLLVVDGSGTDVIDPTQWQQIVLAEAVTQNGIPEGSGVRDYVGAHWGGVTPFALAPSRDGLYFSVDGPPMDVEGDLMHAALHLLRKSAEIDSDDDETMDVSPGAYGNNPLGSNDGLGHDKNPVTGKPYEPQVVLRGDFSRVLAEFWADGPESETPPGHWNTLANYVADHDMHHSRLFGTGQALDPLAWDVHVYLALNGALHDAAIAAWQLKRHYTSARPITLIRYFAGLGQRSKQSAPSYHPQGIELVPDLVEVIDEESSAPGQRHEHLQRYVGDIAVRSWRGEPGDRKTEVGRVDWILGVDWIPYQRRTFVTPAFPGYVSGHSTFSRAGAEVLAAFTGDEFFPGGMGSYRIEPGFLVFEHGPKAPFDLRWATYFDAADQAGQSRLWGGIHVQVDDLDGRRIGATIGRRAVEKARRYFAPNDE